MKRRKASCVVRAPLAREGAPTWALSSRSIERWATESQPVSCEAQMTGDYRRGDVTRDPSERRTSTQCCGKEDRTLSENPDRGYAQVIVGQVLDQASSAAAERAS
jgi:hypothetical protein